MEATAAINRRTRALAYAAATAERLHELARAGYIVQYPLNDQRTPQAISAALQYGLRGADSIYVALAEELQFRLITTDSDFKNYPPAIVLR